MSRVAIALPDAPASAPWMGATAAAGATTGAARRALFAVAPAIGCRAAMIPSATAGWSMRTVRPAATPTRIRCGAAASGGLLLRQRRAFFGAAPARMPVPAPAPAAVNVLPLSAPLVASLSLAAAAAAAEQVAGIARLALPEGHGLALVLESLALFAVVWQLRSALGEAGGGSSSSFSNRTASGLAAVASGLAGYLLSRETNPSVLATIEMNVLWAMTLILALDALNPQPRATAEERRVVDDLLRAGIADRRAAERLLRSVVTVTAAAKAPKGSRSKGASSTGTGWVYDRARGIVVTCQHVVAAAAGPGGTVVIHTQGVRVPCRIIGTDAARDLAVLRACTPGGRLPAWVESARIGTSPPPATDAVPVARLLGKGVLPSESYSDDRLGSAFTEFARTADPRRVFAVRHPDREDITNSGDAGVCSGMVLSNLPGYTMWLGHSASVLATDAPILRGYSEGRLFRALRRGPLVNSRGEVVGVNHIGISRESAIRSGLGSHQTWPSSLSQVSLALSADEVVRLVDVFTRRQKLSDPFLGVTVDPDHDETRAPGAPIRNVLEGSAAFEGGLRPQDRVIVFDGTEIRGRLDLGRALYAHAWRDRVQIVALRGGRRVTFRLELGTRGPHAARWIW
eukprot:tig00020909_g15333.t1